MQLVSPVDVEDALRTDLQALLPSVRCYAPPPTDVQPGDLMVRSAGGRPATTVTHEHTVYVDVWAVTDADAMELASVASGLVASLPLRSLSTEWKTADANTPYPNPDPDRPTIPRATFTATLTARGNEISL